MAVSEETDVYQVNIDVTFLGHSIKKSGAFWLKFDIPTEQIYFALLSANFIGVSRQIEVSITPLGEKGDEETAFDENEEEKPATMRVGILKFEKMVINRGGDSVLTLFGERLDDMSMEKRELSRLLERSMVLHLREA